MIALRIDELADAVGGRLAGGDPATSITGISTDSRAAGAGECFFAIVGERFDGHDFTAEAAAAGAAAVVVQRPADDRMPEQTAVVEVADTTAALQALGAWLRRHLNPTVVAITGSLGKTTTKELSAALLRLRYRVHATPGNLNNHWGLPLSLLGLEPQHDVMVAELAMSRAGEIEALTRMASPDVGLITNIAPAHMENFADLDEVAAAKGELAAALAPDATLIVSADDPRTAAMAERFAGRVNRIVTFGESDEATVRASRVEKGERSWSLRLTVGDDGDFDVVLNMTGRPALANFLAATAVAWVLDVAAADIAAAASRLQILDNRGGIRRLAHDVTLIDESYNASPVAVTAALETLAGLTGGRKIALLGDMLELGHWAESSHRRVGNRAAELGIDLLAVVGDFAGAISDGAAESGLPKDSIFRFDAPAAAGRWLAAELQPGDVVLVKGSRSVHMEHAIAEFEQPAAIPETAVEN